MSSELRTTSGPVVEIRCGAYERFDDRHADLFRRAWRAYLSRGEIKPLEPAQLRALYEANPSGESVIATATQGDRWVGAIAGLATDVQLPSGGTARAFQIGDFMVDEAVQRRGVGSRLLAALRDLLRERGDPVYTFPNRRSIEVFRRQAFEEIRSLRPLLFGPATPARTTRRLAERGLMARGLDLERAAAFADELAGRAAPRPRLLKRGAHLRWRFGQLRNPGDFHFLGLESRAGAPEGLVVSTRYRFRGIPFGVVVDALGADRIADPLRCGLSLGAGGWIGFATVERDAPAPPLALELPRRFQPRPVRLLVPPGDPRSRALFSDCRFATADWMGF